MMQHTAVALLFATGLVFCGVAEGMEARQSPETPSPLKNVLLVIVDNMRPDLGVYAVKDIISPNMDKLAAEGTLFSRAYCALAWCAPSRNSFMTGRRPDRTKAWNFVDHFREGNGINWISMPEYFKNNNYFTSAIGKVFHPDLPPNFDYPKSWSEQPYFPLKDQCPENTMSCPISSSNKTWLDVDVASTDHALEQLQNWEKTMKSEGTPFFIAVGYQSPRLPWSFPASVLQRYKGVNITLAKERSSPPSSSGESLEWFRPNEVDMYSDIENVTYANPMSDAKQREVKLGYYSAITHVDDQVGMLMTKVEEMGLLENTTVVLMADHGQNIGEHNLWSMMSTMETSLRVPLAIYAPHLQTDGNTIKRRNTNRNNLSKGTTKISWKETAKLSFSNPLWFLKDANRHAQVSTYSHPVELTDIFPTLVALSGLPQPPPSFRLEGIDLSAALTNSSAVLKDAAYGQITRCHNCTESYFGTGIPCHYDEEADSHFTVPCCKTNKTRFDYMGMSIRTQEWRYTTYCAWNGTLLKPIWTNCTAHELFDHREDTQLYNVDDFENDNVVADFPSVAASLFQRLKQQFQNDGT
eukprot:m.2733 g.2733  ORF g.2733 m.2733 type:complete len:581 (-) comp1917_c0_seq1:235-1977(-)